MLKGTGAPILAIPGNDKSCLRAELEPYFSNKRGKKKSPKVKVVMVMDTEVYEQYMMWLETGRPKDQNGSPIIPDLSSDDSVIVSAGAKRAKAKRVSVPLILGLGPIRLTDTQAHTSSTDSNTDSVPKEDNDLEKVSCAQHLRHGIEPPSV